MKFGACFALIFFLWAGPVLGAQPAQAGLAPAKASKAKTLAAKASGKAAATAEGQAPQKPLKKVAVTDVQVYSGRDYSRIVVVLTGEAQRHWQLLPPDSKDGGVRRLYVDLDNAVIRPGVPGRFNVRGDVARKVRLSYFKPGVTRLVVEVENLKNQQVFAMENPCRVIVDVQGEASQKEPGKERAKSSENRGTNPGEGRDADQAGKTVAGLIRAAADRRWTSCGRRPCCRGARPDKTWRARRRPT